MKTAKRETCDDAVAGALRQGLEDLQRRMGSEMTRWRWDAVHLAMFPHALDSVATLRPILSRSVGIAGDWSTVNVSVTAADHPYESTHDPRLSGNHRPVIRQRQPVPRRGGSIRPSAVPALRGFPERLAGCHAPQDANEPRRY